MPLKKCKDSKDSGYKWGDSGTCYTGKDAKQKAIKQGLAIEGPENFKNKINSSEIELDTTDINTVSNYMINNFGIGAAAAIICSLYKKG